MKKITKNIENKLKQLSNKTNNLFLKSNITILSKKHISTTIKSKYQQDNYDIILSQLPSGIYTHINQVINIIKRNINTNNINTLNYSPLNIERQDFKYCKKLSYNTGNIITGRDEQINKTITSLTRKQKRNVILVGPAGCGKSAIVEAINNDLLNQKVPKQLIGCKIYNMDLNYIFTHYKDGDPMDVVIKILETASKDPKNILFIDEIHTILESKLGNILKPYLTGTIRFIGATTSDEFHHIITQDQALERRFTVIRVNEPNIIQTNSMLTKTKSVFEKYHNCTIDNNIIKYIVENGTRYLGHRCNPDKSLDVLDIACTLLNKNEIKEHMNKTTTSKDILTDIDKHIKSINTLKRVSGNRKLNSKYVNLAISYLTNINYEKIRNGLDYKNVVKNMKRKIIGQDEAIKEVANIVNLMKYINFVRSKPLGVILLVGPPGTGKLTIAEQLTENIYGSTDNLIDYDIGQLKQAFQITELKGSPPGYVGHNKTGKFIKRVKSNPQSIILFKNITECHIEILDYIINALKAGKFEDAAGRVVNLNNAIVILSVTLNSNSEKDIYTRKTLGFGPKNNEDNSNINKIVSKNVTDICTSIIKLNKLSKNNLEDIYDLNISKYLNMYKDVNIDLKELKDNILNTAKNGTNIINGLSNDIPKLLFKS